MAVAFVAFGAFVLSSFESSFLQGVFDGVNFANPLLVIFVILLALFVVGGWAASRKRN